jgi:hypothetical protein
MVWQPNYGQLFPFKFLNTLWLVSATHALLKIGRRVELETVPLRPIKYFPPTLILQSLLEVILTKINLQHFPRYKGNNETARLENPGAQSQQNERCCCCTHHRSFGCVDSGTGCGSAAIRRAKVGDLYLGTVSACTVSLTGHVADGRKADGVATHNRPFSVALGGITDMNVCSRHKIDPAVAIARCWSGANVVHRIGTDNDRVFGQSELHCRVGMDSNKAE